MNKKRQNTHKVPVKHRRAPAQRDSASAKRPTLSAELTELQQVTGSDDIRVLSDEDGAWVMRLGCLVDLDIRRWRAEQALTLQDLGLPEPTSPAERSVFRELMTLGTRRLLPPKYLKRLDSLDSSARKWLTQNSYKTRFGPFVDVGRYQEWRAGNERFQQQYFALRDEIYSEWHAIGQWRNEQYTIAARRAFAQLKKLAPKSLVDAQSNPIGEQQFVEQYVVRALLKAPTRQEVYDRFGYTVVLSYIPLPSQLAQDLAERERIAAQRALERIAETTILNDRSNQLAAMHADVTASAAANSPAVVQEFVRDLQVQCIETVLAKLENVKSSIAKNGDALVGKAAAQLKNALASYQAMSLVGHPRLDARVARLTEMMACAADKRQIGTIVESIEDIANLARQTLTALKLST